MSCSAKIETRYRTNVLTIPIQSIAMRAPKPKTNLLASATNKLTSASNTTAKAGATHEPAVAQSTNAEIAPANLASLTSTNDLKKKPGEEEKPIEIVFVIDKDRVKTRPVKGGISDDSFIEVTDGLNENEEVVSGGYKAIARELEDGKAIVIGAAKPDLEAKK